MNEVAET